MNARPTPTPRLERVGEEGRGRSRAGIVAIALLLFLLAAIVKPWDTQPQPLSPSGTQSVDVPGVSEPAETPGSGHPSDRPASPAAGADPPYIPPPPAPVPVAAVKAALQPHDGWGIRAVELASGGGSTGPLLEERWVPAVPPAWAFLLTGGGVVEALGVTAPVGTMVLDARAVVQLDGQEWWLDLQPLDVGNPGASVLFWPPRGQDGWEPGWPPRSYRFLILTASGVTSIGVNLVGPGSGQGQSADSRIWRGSEVGEGWTTTTTPLPSGLFAGTIPLGSSGPPLIVPLGGRPRPPADLGPLWLDAEPGRATPGGASGISAFLPRAVTIGLVGPPDLQVSDARLRRLLPLPDSPDALIPVRPVLSAPVRPGAGTVIRFDAPNGRAWPPGVYGVELVGDGPAGPERPAYSLSLLPGSARETLVPLAAVRLWARYAGAWGVAAGHREPLEAPGRTAVRFARQEPEPVSQEGADFSSRCLQLNLIDSAVPIVGISHPIEVRPQSVAIEQVFADGTTELPPPAVAPSVLPGLTMVAAGEGSHWMPGWYQLVLRWDGGMGTLPVCVGGLSDGRLLVPADAGRRGR